MIHILLMAKHGFKLKFRGKAINGSFSHDGEKFLRSSNIIVENIKHFNLKDRTFSTKHIGWETDTKALINFENKIREWVLEARTKGINQAVYAREKWDLESKRIKSRYEAITIDSKLYETIYQVVMHNPEFITALGDKSKKKNKNKLNDYYSVFKIIRDYQIAKNIEFTLNDLNSQLLKDMFEFQKSPHNQYFGKYESAKEYEKVYIRKRSDTTLSDDWGVFKSILVTIHQDLGVALPASTLQFKCKRGIQKTPVFVQYDEFNNLFNYKPFNELEQKVMDYMIVSVGTGLNFYDIYDLNEDNFIQYNDFYRINVRRNKTGSLCRIPLTTLVYDTFKKYNFKMNFIEDYQFNSIYREIMGNFDCFHKLDTFYSRENNLTEPIKRLEILSHENFRKTYITYCFDLGIMEAKIRNRVGHQDGRQMIHYADHDERYIKPEIKELMKKFILVSPKD